MGNAFNTQVFYNGTSAAASGDTYVTLAQSVTEFVKWRCGTTGSRSPCKPSTGVVSGSGVHPHYDTHAGR